MQQKTTSARGKAAKTPDGVGDAWAPRDGKIGICCSGGGVRSASFNLGALQALQDAGVMREAEFLTSVSGGGYTAGAMTMVAGSEERLVWDEGCEPPFQPGSPEERYLRNRSSYLAPGVTGKLRLAANVLRGLLLNVSVLAAVLAFAGFWLGVLTSHTDRGFVHFFAVQVPIGSAILLGAWLLLSGWRRVSVLSEDTQMQLQRWVFRFALACWLVFGVAPWVIGGVTQAATGEGWLVDTLNWMYARVSKDAANDPAPVTTLTQIGAVLAALGVPALLAGAARSVSAKAGKVAGRVAIWFVVPLLSALLVVTVAVAAANGVSDAERVWLGVEAAFVLAALAIVDINAGSMHRFYKRRLCTAFALERVIRGTDGKVVRPKQDAPLPAGELDATERDYDVAVKFSKAFHKKGQWPQLVCCAAANIGEETVTPPGRHAVSFTFSSEYIGGPEVGWAKTTDYEKVLGDVRAEDMTIPAAVAISGAALAPCMGVMTKPYLRSLLTLVNARLGVWLPSPGWIKDHTEAVAKSERARPSFWWLVKEATGRNRHDSKFLYITDGGHWENLGLVELLRRGCSTIYCIDASGDQEKTFFTIGQAVSMARSELEVDIAIDPAQMLPLPDDPKQYSQRDHVIGTITYPEGDDGQTVAGKLAFIKAQVTRDAPWDVRAYKEKDPAFPNHSLMAQMFADQTFEAYRALGYHAAKGAIASMATQSEAAAGGGGTPPVVPPDPAAPMSPAGASAEPSAGAVPTQESRKARSGTKPRKGA